MANSNKPKAATKSEVFQEIADSTGLTRKQVASVFDAMNTVINGHLRDKKRGLFTIPGLLKIKRVEKPATKERQGINPRTGETITIKAKPKRTVVRAIALKNLKQMVQ